MKKLLVLVAVLLVSATASYAQYQIPEGKMDLNVWSGKITVGGMEINEAMLPMYFSPEEQAMYRSANTLSYIGGGLIGFGIGYALGDLAASLITGKRSNGAVYITCGCISLIGVPFYAIGMNKAKKAIASYNSSHGYSFRPELDFGVQANGVGFALNF
jgi:hypothetical protein